MALIEAAHPPMHVVRPLDMPGGTYGNIVGISPHLLLADIKIKRSSVLMAEWCKTSSII